MKRISYRQLALDRASNCIIGDLACGGYGEWLEQQGYTTRQIIAAERAYRKLGEQLLARAEKMDQQRKVK